MGNNIAGIGSLTSRRSAGMFIFLALLPNLSGLLSLPTAWDIKIHFFQFAVFLAAFIFGPLGGLISGAAGSFATAVMMGNPAIIAGNAILGFFAGYFFRRGFNPAVAAILAFLIQLPWLAVTGYYLQGLSAGSLAVLAFVLGITNPLWAMAASLLMKPARRIME